MSFERELQERLIARGANIEADGDFGIASRNALIAFQRSSGLPPTGVADKASVAALFSTDGGSVAVPSVSMPPWMAEMYRRKGLHEGRDNGVLSKWLRAGSYLGNPAKLPWCGDAIETCFVKTLIDEPVPSNPFWAQAWKGFGRDAGGPLVGAVGVIRWSASAGHVGIVVGYDQKRGLVYMLGGNQSNAITIAGFSIKKFIAFRWPKSVPIATYPALKADSFAPMAMAGTR